MVSYRFQSYVIDFICCIMTQAQHVMWLMLAQFLWDTLNRGRLTSFRFHRYMPSALIRGFFSFRDKVIHLALTSHENKSIYNVWGDTHLKIKRDISMESTTSCPASHFAFGFVEYHIMCQYLQSSLDFCLVRNKPIRQYLLKLSRHSM